MSARPKTPTTRGTGPKKTVTPDDQLDNQKTSIFDSGNFKKETGTPVKAISMKTKPGGVEAISMKTPSAEKIPMDGVDTRPKPKVKLRALSEVHSAPIQQDLGRLAPPRDAGAARVRKVQDYILWGSVSVILASVVALAIWFIAR